MDNRQFVTASRRQAARIASYINDEAPAMVARKTLRFIDGNFRAQGWQGASFQKWQETGRNATARKKFADSGKSGRFKGSILIKTGRLRRGVNYTTNGRGEVRFYNNVKYARAHNEGLTINTTASVRGFTRRSFMMDEVSAPGARKTKYAKVQTGEHQVKAHTRQMKFTMPKRQFMPYEGHSSPVLESSIKRELEKEFKRILTL